jgi:hypothetical protein
MSDNPTGFEQLVNGLEMMAENCTGYRSLLSVLEVTIELNGWFSNVGDCYGNHQRFNKIEEKIIPKITSKPMDLDRSTWDVAKDIQARHGHMSVYAAESAAEYWQDR